MFLDGKIIRKEKDKVKKKIGPEGKVKALVELVKAVEKVGGEDQLEMLSAMIEGRRLRDISDWSLDLAI